MQILYWYDILELGGSYTNMKNTSILIIDESSLIREYLSDLFRNRGLSPQTAVSGVEGLAKMRSNLPDFIILDFHLSRLSCKELLQEKAKDPNTSSIPVILLANKIDRNNLLELVPYNIKKVFMKPLKIDAFLQTITELTGIPFDIDTTPCQIDAHVTNSIIFIEISQGLNNDKIDLLYYKIKELLELYALQNPYVIVMLSSMEFSFIDGANLEKLLTKILDASQAQSKNIKLISSSSFLKEFIFGHPEYSMIEVVTSLEYALDSTSLAKAGEDPLSSIITTQTAPNGAKASNILMQFELDAQQMTADTPSRKLNIASVDDDFVIQELIKTTFASVNAQVTFFPNGEEFLKNIEENDFDIVFLDLRMPGLNGFQVMDLLQSKNIETPIIILSAVSQKEAIMKAFQYGVKTYLVKPLKPEQILQKTIEVLKTNF